VNESPADDGVVASGVAMVEIEEAERLLASGGVASRRRAPLRPAARRPTRLAARLAAKRAACRLFGGDAAEREVEVRRGAYGPPSLRLVGAAAARMRALGASRVLVSLTHERRHAAALVVLLRDGWLGEPPSSRGSARWRSPPVRPFSCTSPTRQ
jgi:holo-[acyl-carrier protein] synthase